MLDSSIEELCGRGLSDDGVCGARNIDGKGVQRYPREAVCASSRRMQQTTDRTSQPTDEATNNVIPLAFRSLPKLGRKRIQFHLKSPPATRVTLGNPHSPVEQSNLPTCRALYCSEYTQIATYSRCELLRESQLCQRQYLETRNILQFLQLPQNRTFLIQYLMQFPLFLLIFLQISQFQCCLTNRIELVPVFQ